MQSSAILEQSPVLLLVQFQHGSVPTEYANHTQIVSHNQTEGRSKSDHSSVNLALK